MMKKCIFCGAKAFHLAKIGRQTSIMVEETGSIIPVCWRCAQVLSQVIPGGISLANLHKQPKKKELKAAVAEIEDILKLAREYK